MRGAPPVLGVRGELRREQLLLAADIPQSELGAQFAAIHHNLARDKRLRLDLAPIGEARFLFETGDLLDIGFRRQRIEETRTAEIIGNDGRYIGAEFLSVARTADKGRQRDRQRIDLATGYVDFDGAARDARSAEPPKRQS